MNQIKAFLLLAGCTLFLLIIGDLLGGHTGFFVGLVLAIFMNIFAYGNADAILFHLYHAHALPANDSSNVHAIVATLSGKAGLPTPKIYSIVSDAPTVFVTGRSPNNATLVVTTGLISLLNQDELTAIMAQSLSRIARYDMFVGSVSAVISGFLCSLAKTSTWSSLIGDKKSDEKLNSTAIAILGPIAAFIIRLVVSPSAELTADRAGATLCGHSAWLISALEKLYLAQNTTTLLDAQTNPSSAHLFIVNPLKNQRLAKMFSNHPEIRERVRQLNEMPA